MIVITRDDEDPTQGFVIADEHYQEGLSLFDIQLMLSSKNKTKKLITSILGPQGYHVEPSGMLVAHDSKSAVQLADAIEDHIQNHYERSRFFSNVEAIGGCSANHAVGSRDKILREFAKRARWVNELNWAQYSIKIAQTAMLAKLCGISVEQLNRYQRGSLWIQPAELQKIRRAIACMRLNSSKDRS